MRVSGAYRRLVKELASDLKAGLLVGLDEYQEFVGNPEFYLPGCLGGCLVKDFSSDGSG